MSHYKSNVRDQVFNLFEVLGVDKALGQGEYADLDADTAQEMLSEISRLAEGPVAEMHKLVRQLDDCIEKIATEDRAGAPVKAVP